MRLREEGHVFTGEVLVVPKSNEKLLENLSKLADEVLELSWKLYDVVVVPVKELDIPTPQDEEPEGGEDEDTEKEGSLSESKGLAGDFGYLWLSNRHPPGRRHDSSLSGSA